MPLLLLVDDASEIAAIVRLLARRCGQEVAWQSDGASALGWLRAGSRRPDLLLLDLHLPGEGGIQVFQSLQQAGVLAGVATALFTQGISPDDLAESLDAGIDFVVNKELLTQPIAWKERITEVIKLAAAPPVARPVDQLDPRRLADDVVRALRHPILARLGDRGLQAFWGRARIRAGAEQLNGEDKVDSAISSVTLERYFTPLAATRPEIALRLVLSLAYQAECLLGRAASEQVRAALVGSILL